MTKKEEIILNAGDYVFEVNLGFGKSIHKRFIKNVTPAGAYRLDNGALLDRSLTIKGGRNSYTLISYYAPNETLEAEYIEFSLREELYTLHTKLDLDKLTLEQATHLRDTLLSMK